MEKLAKNIKYFREKQNLTQHDLAEKLNVSRTVVTKWENSTQTPDLPSLVNLSTLFDISIDTLVGKALSKEEVLKEIRKIYSVEDPYANNKLVAVIDYLKHNDRMQELFYSMIVLPDNKRRPIEEILATAITEISNLYS